MHDGYDYLRFHCVVGFLSVLFYCSIGWLLLKDAAYVLLVLYWSLLLFFILFSSWFGWLNFIDEFLFYFSVFAHHIWVGDIFRFPKLLGCYYLVFAYLIFDVTMFSRREVRLKFWIDFHSRMFSLFDCCLTELYRNLHKLFCAIILDFIPLVWFPMVDSRLIFKTFGVNLSLKDFSKNSLCDKRGIFLFLIQSRQNASFFISSSLLVFLPWFFRTGI